VVEYLGVFNHVGFLFSVALDGARAQGEKPMEDFVSSRLQRLKEEIEALGQQSRELATSAERSRIQTLKKSDEKIEELGRQTRELATSVESSRIEAIRGLSAIAAHGQLRENRLPESARQDVHASI